MVKRQQLPPQIRKVRVADRSSGRAVQRYQLVVDVGSDPHTGKRRQVRRRFLTEKAARNELAKVQGGTVTGTYMARSTLTVDQACEEWLESRHSLKRSTMAGHRSKLEAFREQLGHIEVQKLSKAHLDSLVARVRQGGGGRKPWSARSVNYLLYLVTAVLDDLIKQGDHLVRNVARLVDRMPGDPKTYRTLTDMEMFTILDHEGRDRHLWSLALYGLRRGEIAGLLWEHINLTETPLGHGESELPARSLRIVDNRVAVGGEVLTGTPKSRASRRTLPLPEDVVEVLRTARKMQREERLAFGEGYGSGDYVACDGTGQPYHPNLLTYRWSRLLAGLNIDHVRLHDARHSCGTLMHLRGVPIAVIAAWLGHASAAFTMSVYAHSQDAALRDAGMSFQRVVTFCDTQTTPAGS